MPLNFTKPQLIAAAIVAFIVVVLGLIFAGVIPGLRSTSGPESVTGALAVWGLDSADAMDLAVGDFKTVYPEVTVSYRAFRDADEYGRALLDALAAGRGPDVFAVENRALLRDMAKLVPAPATVFSLTQLRQLFPKTIEQDFAPKGSIYALPLFVDTLALFSNRALLEKAGIALPPATWEAFQADVPKLVQVNASGTIAQAAAAIGGSRKNIGEAADILSLLMLQSGVKMNTPNLSEAAFSNDQGVQALRFYTQFANPASTAYTWNEALPAADELFIGEQLAMIFKYGSFMGELAAKNAFLDYRISPMPQPQAANTFVAYPRYWGYGVARQSRSANLAWQFVARFATNPAVAQKYAALTRRPPALLSLKSAFENDPALGVFANQTLTARSWTIPDPDAVAAIFSDAIVQTIGAPTRIGEVLQSAEERVTQLLTKAQ